MKTFQIDTSDGFKIAVTSFGENNATKKIIVISSAIGVKQTFYAKYATYLANKGYLVFTYDYRGIGDSKPKKLKDFEAHFTDWADKDFLGLTQYIEEFYPNHEKFLIGHSIGGIMIGLTRAYKVYDKIVTIGSQYGYIKNFHQKDKPKVNFFFRIAIPILSAFYGFFPSQKVGMGEPIPALVLYYQSYYIPLCTQVCNSQPLYKSCIAVYIPLSLNQKLQYILGYLYNLTQELQWV